MPNAVLAEKCNGHSKINRKLGISTFYKIPSSQKILFRHLAHVITSGTSPTCKFWGRSARRGVVPKYVKYNTFVTFVTVLFFSILSTGQTAALAHTLMAQTTCFRARRCFFEVRMKSDASWGKYVPPPKNGRK